MTHSPDHQPNATDQSSHLGMPSSNRQRPSKQRRWIRRLLGSLLVLALLIAGALVWLSWMIAPQREPSLTYTDIDLRTKIIEMVQQRKLETTLTPAEFNNVAKRELLDRAQHFPPGVRVTGAEFSWKGSVVQADVRGSLWGIPFGGLLDFDAVQDGNALVLTHRHTTVKHGSLDWPRLEPIRISLNKYLPAIAKVSDLQFGEDQITLTFKLDLLTIPRLLWR